MFAEDQPTNVQQPGAGGIDALHGSADAPVSGEISFPDVCPASGHRAAPRGTCSRGGDHPAANNPRQCPKQLAARSQSARADAHSF
ncbi:hypothetical protein AAFF_G00351500 [Aldrovandia affinis]|uniref:Uncharacterized protein n=1 Tax=Aldrovandia affinis TaxID=143900 RepID=A0AAD7WNN3_9TELE|nr:hypothetical protein AAFF_G00351500 [Aldrovandia affinis]